MSLNSSLQEAAELSGAAEEFRCHSLQARLYSRKSRSSMRARTNSSFVAANTSEPSCSDPKLQDFQAVGTAPAADRELATLNEGRRDAAL